MTCVRPPIRAFLVLSLLSAVAIPAFGQSEDLPTQLWLSFQHQRRVGEKTRVFSSLGYEELTSRESFWGEWNKLYVNGGGSYDLGERFRVAGGVGLYYTYQPEVADLFEFRLWQEGTAFWPDSPGAVRRLVFTHRQRSRSTIEEDFTRSGNVIDFTVKSSFRIRDLVKGR